MNRRHAAEIRRGIRIARQHMNHERTRPKLTPFGFGDAPPMPLWERAYHHTIGQAIRSGRLRPPSIPLSRKAVAA